MNTIDDLVSESLRKHLILNNKIPKIIENRPDNTNGYIKFDIGLSCLDNDDKYYHKFIKGILKYMKIFFNKDYLYYYLQRSYFENLEKSSNYIDNIEDISSSLKKMSDNIKLVLKMESDYKVSLHPEDNEKMDEKMEKNKYNLLYLKAQLHKVKNLDVVGIYERCKNNTEIVQEIHKLCEEKANIYELLIFEDSIKEYLKIAELEKDKKKMKKILP